LRRAADAPDATAYGSAGKVPGSSQIDDQVTAALSDVRADQIEAGPVTGVSSEPWTVAQQRLADAATVAPLAQVRTWLIGDDGVWGPQATGAAAGPLWNAAVWSITRR
jgi:hypothetical protein